MRVTYLLHVRARFINKLIIKRHVRVCEGGQDMRATVGKTYQRWYFEYRSICLVQSLFALFFAQRSDYQRTQVAGVTRNTERARERSYTGGKLPIEMCQSANYHFPSTRAPS